MARLHVRDHLGELAAQFRELLVLRGLKAGHALRLQHGEQSLAVEELDNLLGLLHDGLADFGMFGEHFLRLGGEVVAGEDAVSRGGRVREVRAVKLAEHGEHLVLAARLVEIVVALVLTAEDGFAVLVRRFEVGVGEDDGLAERVGRVGRRFQDPLAEVAARRAVGFRHDVDVGEHARRLLAGLLPRQVHDTEVLSPSEVGSKRIRTHRGMTKAHLDPGVAHGVSLLGDGFAERAVEPHAVALGLSFEGDLHSIQHLGFLVDVLKTRLLRGTCGERGAKPRLHRVELVHCTFSPSGIIASSGSSGSSSWDSSPSPPSPTIWPAAVTVPG